MKCKRINLKIRGMCTSCPFLMRCKLPEGEEARSLRKPKSLEAIRQAFEASKKKEAKAKEDG